MDDKKDKLELDEDIKLEENDNWKFEAEALTLNDTLLENDSVEIEIPGAKAEPVIQKPVVKEDRREPKKGKAKDGNIVKFVLVAVATAIVIAVLTVLGVYYYTVPNSDERMNPGNVAFTVGDTDVSIGMYNYYYTCLVQRDMQYASYYGLDTTKDFAEQITKDEDDNEITWADQFVNETVDQLQYITTYYEEAVKAGVTLTDEQKENIKTQLDGLKEAASQADKSVDEFIQETYGEYCGYATLSKMLEQCFIAENYYQIRQVEVKATDDEIQAYYEAHRDDYISVPFAYLQVMFDGEEVTQKQAEKQAKKYAKQIKSVDDMKKALPKACKDILAQYVGAGYFENVDKAAIALAENIETSLTKTDDSFTEDGLEWLFSDKTKVGDCSTFTDEEHGIVYIVLKTGKPDVQKDEVYSVRHILVMPKDDEGNALKDPTKGTKKQFAEAKAEAEKILDEFNKGDKSETSFAQLAESKSDDIQSTSNGTSGIYGGLCATTRLGDMVEPFEKWSIDKSRKYGDVDIIESKFGYHIVFFIEDTQLYLARCAEAVVAEKEQEFTKNTIVKKHEGAFAKTKVAQPVEGSANDDDSDNMDY